MSGKRLGYDAAILLMVMTYNSTLWTLTYKSLKIKLYAHELNFKINTPTVHSYKSMRTVI